MTRLQALVLIASVLICLPLSATGWAQESTDVDEQAREAKELAIESERLGMALLSVLRDDTQPVRCRELAIVALGKLRFEPAIPLLIERVELRDPSRITIKSFPQYAYVSVAALAKYGSLAVPAVVEAYVAERDDKRRELFWTVLKLGKRERVAAMYARGLVATTEDAEVRGRTDALIERLERSRPWHDERRR